MGMQDLVEQFHMKYGFPVCEDIRHPSEKDYPGDEVLETMADHLEECQELTLGQVEDDLRVARATLIMEEVRELMTAMAMRDLTQVADALADIQYVVYGTAVAYGIPLDPCMAEVHRSNMTKDCDGRFKPRKGSTYSPPRLERILQQDQEEKV